MVHGSLFKLKSSIISLKKEKNQKNSLKSKMLSDLTSTSDVTLSGEDNDSKPKQNGFCMFVKSCSKNHINTLYNHTEFLSCKTLSVKSVEHILMLGNLLNNIWWKCTLSHKRHLSVLTVLGLVNTWCCGLKEFLKSFHLL